MNHCSDKVFAMTAKKSVKSLPIRFMGKHPVFGKTKKTRGMDGEIKNTSSGVRFDKSPYYWWWRALRASEKYQAACNNQGDIKDAKLSKLYEDFGNVLEGDFESWWRKNGERLFGEPPAPMSVRFVEFEDIESYRATVENQQTLLIAVPLFLTKREIASSVRKLVAKKHKGKKGRSSITTRTEKSQALYKLNHFKSMDVVIRAIETYEKRKSGSLLKELTKSGEEIQIASRFHRMGKNIIANVEKGFFPISK
jgi:hypothetical protein